jgi:hypothetical protein
MTAVLPPRTTSLRIERPGVYDMDEADYFGDPVEGGSLSTSGAKLLLPPSCPAKYRWEMDHPSTPKSQFDVGHAAHKLVLGVGPEIVPVDADDWRTKAAREARDEAHEAGKVPLLVATYRQVQAMAAALRQHPFAYALLKPDSGKPEQSLFWRDEQAGIWCRSRLDWLPTAVRGRRFIIPDYKTSTTADPSQMQRLMFSYGYQIQHWFYCDGVRSLGIDTDPSFVFIVQEKTPPYLVTVFEFDDEAVQMGETLARRARRIFAECSEANAWPGYADDVATVSPPAWLSKNFDYFDPAYSKEVS